MTLWVVRAGKYGEREELALDNKLAIIGWEEVPDLASLKTGDDLFAALERVYPQDGRGTLVNWKGQLWAFSREMKPDDLIVMPLKTRSMIALGVVAGPYAFRTDLADVKHTRKVEWRKEVPRASFAQDLLFSFGGAMTVFRVKRNNAESRVGAVMAGEADPAFAHGVGGRSSQEGRQSTHATDEESNAVNLAEVADDEIRSRLATLFAGHKLSHLVGQILEAQGYRTDISPPGPDGGVDIIAGKGPLGFDPPRLVVQVKSQESPVDVSVLQQLQGAISAFNADQGLLVAWGGVTKVVTKDARRAFFQIRVWDAGDLVRELQASYFKLPKDVQAEVPLKQIWILADDKDED